MSNIPNQFKHILIVKQVLKPIKIDHNSLNNSQIFQHQMKQLVQPQWITMTLKIKEAGSWKEGFTRKEGEEEGGRKEKDGRRRDKLK